MGIWHVYPAGLCGAYGLGTGAILLWHKSVPRACLWWHKPAKSKIQINNIRNECDIPCYFNKIESMYNKNSENNVQNSFTIHNLRVILKQFSNRVIHLFYMLPKFYSKNFLIYLKHALYFNTFFVCIKLSYHLFQTVY